MSGICINGPSIEDCFYCYSKQIISAVANKSPIPYNPIKKAPEPFYTECQPKPNTKMLNTAQFLEQGV